MENKTIYRTLSAALLFAALFVFAAGEMAAQDFTMTAGTATYSAGATDETGVIRMRGNGSFDASGTGVALGSATAIPGIVDWSGTATTVQDRIYTNLYISSTGSPIAIGNSTVTGSGYATGVCVIDPGTTYEDLTQGYGYYVDDPVGSRDYTGTFVYAGDSFQYIFPENNTEGAYDNLAFQGAGEKQSDGTTALDGNFDLNIGVSFSHDVTVGQDGAGTSNINDNLDVTTGGSFSIAANTTVNINSGANSELNLYDGGDLNLGANSLLDISDIFTNAQCDRQNMIFAQSSTVAYHTTDVITTADLFPYGNLTMSGAVGDYIPNDAAGCATPSEINIYMAGALNIADNNLVMSNFDGGSGALPGTGGFIQLDGVSPTSDVTYGAGSGPNTVSVVGSMQRVNVNTTDTYTMNNSGSQVSFASVGDAASEYIRLTVHPEDYQGSPGQWDGNNPLSSQTVNRSITVSTNATDGEFDFSTLTLGYVQDEVPAGVVEGRLLMYEGYDLNDPGQLVKDDAGNYIADGTNNQTGYSSGSTIELLATANGGNEDQISSSSDLLLSYSGVFTVAHGRWSDPLTWINGWVPLATDDAYIRHVVYTGNDIANPGLIGGGYPGHQEEETDDSNVGFNGATNPITDLGSGAWLIANSVTITSDEDDGGTAFSDYRALIIGGSDPDMASTGAFDNILTFGRGSSIFRGLYNENDEQGDPWTSWGTSYDAGNGLQGLYVLSCDEPEYTPIIRASNFENVGAVRNEGIIEIGD